MMAALRADPRYASSATLQTSAESMLFFDDPADHSRQRRLVSQAFTNRTVTELRPWVQALVDRLLDECLSRPVFDFMGDFVDQIPVAVICHMLGVPDRDIDTFKDWNFVITATTGAHRSDEQVAEADRATTNLLGYLNDLLDARAKALEAAAECLVEDDDRVGARLAFEQAMEVYEFLGAEADLNRVQAEFRSYGIRRGPHSKHRRAQSGWESLTDAELKVAAFVEEGLSNPDIAARLMLSRRTVATHVSHILKKLEVATRTDIARESALRVHASE